LSEELGCNPDSVLTPRLIIHIRRYGSLLPLFLFPPPTNFRVTLQIFYKDIAPTVATQLCPGTTVIFVFLQFENRKFQVTVLADSKPQRALRLL
jgi:hypothetical protein